MQQIKDANAERKSPLRQLPAPERKPHAWDLAPEKPIGALLQAIASEISQSDQRQSGALANLRERLNIMTERSPTEAAAAAAAVQKDDKPRAGQEERRQSPRLPSIAAPQAPVAALPAPAVKSESAPAPLSPKAEPASSTVDILGALYSSVAGQYSEAVRNRTAKAATPEVSGPVAVAVAEEAEAKPEIEIEDSVEEEDSGFLDMAALADADFDDVMFEPDPRPLPAARTVPPRETPVPAPIVAQPVPQPPVQAIPSPAPLAVVDASLAIDRSIAELSARIAETERKIEDAIVKASGRPVLEAMTAQIDTLRGDLDRLSIVQSRVSEAVGEVAGTIGTLSESAARIGPVSDMIGALNEAIASLRKELPVVAEQSAIRVENRLAAALLDRPAGDAAAPARDNDLADRLAIVHNMLLARASEDRDASGRSLGAIETVRDLVQNLHNRIDAMEAAEETVAEPAFAGPAPAMQARREPVLAAEPPLEAPSQMTQADLIASARRAAMASSREALAQAQAAAPEPLKTSAAQLRQLATGKSAAGTQGGPQSRLFVILAMVALLMAGLGMVYAKVFRKAPPKVQIEQTALPPMPAGPGDAAEKPTAKQAAQPEDPRKSSALEPEAQQDSGLAAASGEPAALASTVADAMPAPSPARKPQPGVVETVTVVPQGKTTGGLPAAIAPEPLRASALAGDPAAAYAIADRYMKGAGVPRDSGAAMRWFEKSAQAGSALAAFRLGVLNEKGDDGIAASPANAMDWYLRAAKQGNMQAMHNLAVLYTAMPGSEPDYANAAKWFGAAADHGLKDSQFNLAVLYANGLGVKKDAGSAFRWFSLAAKQGDGEAAKQRDTLRKSLSVNRQNEIESELAKWKAKPLDKKANVALAPVASIGEAAPAVTLASTDPEPAALGVSAVQKMLAALGYDPGTLDGTMTGQTREAIRAFETRSDLPVTGEISDALIEKLAGLAG